MIFIFIYSFIQIFLLQSTFFFRNVDVETCLQQKVGKRKNIIFKTWIGIAQTFVTDTKVNGKVVEKCKYRMIRTNV